MPLKQRMRPAEIGPPAGRLLWKRDGGDLVAGRYRVRCIGPEQWETTCRGRLLPFQRRRSLALAMAEHHFREVQRVRQITGFGVSSVVGLLGSIASFLVPQPAGFFVFVISFWLCLSSAARCVAAITRNLLDPYRTRERWEPADWWNR